MSPSRTLRHATPRAYTRQLCSEIGIDSYFTCPFNPVKVVTALLFMGLAKRLAILVLSNALSQLPLNRRFFGKTPATRNRGDTPVSNSAPLKALKRGRHPAGQ
jgi:hypothetical protein